MHSASFPILWSFRRCPYAMRARLAVRASGLTVELREIMLRDKPNAFISASSKATVPALELGNGTVLAESRNIMFWALETSGDPEGWLTRYRQNEEHVNRFFHQLDGSFKTNLDRYKYASRYLTKEGMPINGLAHRTAGAVFLSELNDTLSTTPFLSGEAMGLMDYAALPFIRQFRIADETWFDEQDWPLLHSWLQNFLSSEEFQAVMKKYIPWQNEASPVLFGKMVT